MSEQSFHTAATGDQQLNKSNDSNSQRARTDTTEDNALGDIAKKYEAELMQKRKERQESRALRLQELEKEQRDVSVENFNSERSEILKKMKYYKNVNELKKVS